MTVSKFKIQGAEIGFRNFAGKEGMYNKEGERNFVVFLDEEFADELAREGWNVKYPKERLVDKDEEDERRPYLPVDASLGKYPPKFVLIHGESVERLQEDELEVLDWSRIIDVDMEVRPYEWSVNGNSGVKAYLQSIYVTIETDPFREKYGI